MVKYRYLLVRSGDPVSCYLQLLERYQLVGFTALIHKPRLVAIYDDVLVVGVPREALRAVRAIVALLYGCRTVKTAGTERRAKAVAASIRRRGSGV
ncbi:hypothetical protein [Pyrobaculum neutrophilum]|uniref:Uncharacterized protein n=1 Tax=Pyrobaculum neutrophilum (strain DSM 2338 / JCM 9278 / NBRC 100436 / V24Sta) TaxID=444157 RepID=B1YD40_PYRNV|nr:hypothetical protein [Pyrobaculum neutrophilum]ACB39703.1 conserved hypothetical protein [Pyrobaculum neutrophilum V24Sta]